MELDMVIVFFFTFSVCFLSTTVVPLNTGPLTSGHPPYAAIFSWHEQHSLYSHPSPTATPLTRPAITFFGSK